MTSKDDGVHWLLICLIFSWQALFISQSKQSALTRMGTSIRTIVLNILRVVCDFHMRHYVTKSAIFETTFLLSFVKLWIIWPTSAGFSVFVLHLHWWPFYARSGDNMLKNSLRQICYQPFNQHFCSRKELKTSIFFLSFSASLFSLNWKGAPSNLIPMQKKKENMCWDWFSAGTPF